MNPLIHDRILGKSQSIYKYLEEKFLRAFSTINFL